MATIASLSVNVRTNVGSSIAALKKLDVAIKRTDKTTASFSSRWSGLERDSEGAEEALRQHSRTHDSYSPRVRRSAKETGEFRKRLKGAVDVTGFLNNAISTLKLPTLILGLNSAAGAASALTAGALSLVGALAPVGGLAAGGAAGLSALAQAGIVAKVALSGFGEVAKLALTGRADDLGKFAEEMEKLSPPARRFAMDLVRLRPALDKIKDRVELMVFEQVDDGLSRMLTLLPQVESAAVGTAGALGELAQRAMVLAGSDAFRLKFAQITETNRQVIFRLGNAAIHLADALMSVLVAAGPMITVGSRLVERWAGMIRVWANASSESGRMQEFFARTIATTRRLGAIIGNVFGILRAVTGALAPLGEGMLETFESGTENFREFVESARGKNVIREWGDAAMPILRELGLLLSAAAQGLGKIGSEGQTGLAPLIRQVRENLLPVILQIADNAESLGPPLVDLAVQFASLFEAMSGESGPLILFVEQLTKFLETLNWAVDTIPGGKSFFFMLTTGAAGLKAAKFAGAVTGLNMLGRSVKGLAGKSKTFTEMADGVGALSRNSEGVQKIDWSKLGFEKLKKGAKGVGGALKKVPGQLASLATAGAGAAAGGLKSLATGLKGAALAAKAFAVSLLTNPVFLIIAGIIALGVAVFTLYKKWKPFRELVDKVWQQLQVLWDSFLEGARIVGRVLAGAFQKVKEFLSPVLEIFEKLFKGDFLGAFVSLITAMPKLWLKLGKLILQGLVKGLTEGLPRLLGFLAGLTVKFGLWIIQLIPKLVRAGVRLLGGLLRGLGDGIVAVGEWFMALPGKLWEWVKDAGSWLFETGKTLLKGLVRGILEWAPKIWEFVTSMPGKLWELYREAGTWLKEVGTRLIKGLVKGIVERAKGLWQWFRDLPQKVKMIARAMWEKLKSIGGDILNGIIKGIRDGIGKLGEVATEIKDKLVDGFTSAFSIGSPSKVTAGIGVFVGQGLVEGMLSQRGAVADAAGKLSTMATKAMATRAQLASSWAAFHGGKAPPGATRFEDGSWAFTTRGAGGGWAKDKSMPSGAPGEAVRIENMTIVAPDPRVAATETVRRLRTEAHLRGR